MIVSKLTIENFRGIRKAELEMSGHTLLIGGNNVGKSTICEALELALSPERQNRFPVVEEYDFYNASYLDEEGNLIDYQTHQKCASGTGMFIDVLAEALEISLDEMGTLSLKATKDVSITSSCAVFAESEVVTLINEGIEVVDITAGVNNSVAGRLNSMVRKVGLVEAVALTGGCAKNEGLAKSLEGKLGVSVMKLPVDPQIAGAIGAALIAAEKLSKKNEVISS